MKQLLRKLFWADFNPQKIICIIPDEITLVKSKQKIKLRKIQSLIRQMNIENNFYKNFESDEKIICIFVERFAEASQ